VEAIYLHPETILTDPEAQSQTDYLEAIASEHAALIAESAVQVAAIESFGDLPLIAIGLGLAITIFQLVYFNDPTIVVR
jgi:hypothetical protein